jgi:hypothetical protein
MAGVPGPSFFERFIVSALMTLQTSMPALLDCSTGPHSAHLGKAPKNR